MSLPGSISLLARPATFSSAGIGNVDGPASSTNNALVIWDGTTGRLIKNSAVTLTGTDFLGIGATDVTITAGGTNQNITLTPSGTGSVVLFSNANTPAFLTGLQGLHLGAINNTARAVLIDQLASQGLFAIRRANGTASVPTAIASNDSIGSLAGYGYGATAYSSGGRGRFSVEANQNWTDSAQATRATIGFTALGGTTEVTSTFGKSSILKLNDASTSVNFPAWTTAGAGFYLPFATYTDTTSSGTVAAVSIATLGTPTIAASSATTFTAAANLYISADVAAGTNVILTNSYGLWNVGKTRLDGVTTVSAATATPAAGSTAARLLFGTTAGFGIYYGSGAPTVSAAQGSIYLRSDGSGIADRLYVNTTGSTTWTNFVSAA